MHDFKVGDEVVFKKGGLSREWYRNQANGAGTITEVGRGGPLDVEVVWQNGHRNTYASCDLIHYKIHYKENPIDFKIGDKVRIKQNPSRLYSNLWLYQNSIGVVELLRGGDDKTWGAIRWPDGNLRVVKCKDLVLIQEKENSMRTIPTKEQVLEAAEKYPQTKEALEILFPEDFKSEGGILHDLVERPITLMCYKGDNSRISASNIPKELFNYRSFHLNKTTQFILAALQVALEQADNFKCSGSILSDELSYKLMNGLKVYTKED